MRPLVSSMPSHCLSLKYPPVWPDKNRQMSVKVAQKWFHWKNDRFWHLYKNCLRMWEFWAVVSAPVHQDKSFDW